MKSDKNKEGESLSCPYCGKQMEAGYVTSGQKIFFLEYKYADYGLITHSILDSPNNTFWRGCNIRAHYCEDCRKILMDLDEQKIK